MIEENFTFLPAQIETAEKIKENAFKQPIGNRTPSERTSEERVLFSFLFRWAVNASEFIYIYLFRFVFVWKRNVVQRQAHQNT